MTIEFCFTGVGILRSLNVMLLFLTRLKKLSQFKMPFYFNLFIFFELLCSV
eukprot:TRINITY_DN291_c0_g1_i1.p1 TRINITY_DN291_c0_g1~~TRINITY_DN291_c0_g1_i1.p1  ORF type:complete len:51 (+),score=0.38 TRINITY_DN291_c0_g1_i1:143-295(+)